MANPRSRSPVEDDEAVSGTRLLKMVWAHRLFLHWPVDPDHVRPYVPAQLEIDTAQHNAWIGITAFRLTNIRAVLAPPMPGLSSFNEVNARVCVTYRGSPGVYFFSLDASSSVAVWTARTFLHLPYFRARIQNTRRADSYRFVSRRTHQGAQPAHFDCTWTTGKPLAATQRKDLAHFLTERRQTFTIHRGTVYVCQVAHEPWPLREAKVTSLETNLFPAAGLPEPEGTPLAYHGDRLAVDMLSAHAATEREAAPLLDPVVAPPATFTR